MIDKTEIEIMSHITISDADTGEMLVVQQDAAIKPDDRTEEPTTVKGDK